MSRISIPSRDIKKLPLFPPDSSPSHAASGNVRSAHQSITGVPGHPLFRSRRDLSGIEAMGVDDVQWRNGHTSLTPVSQIDTVKRPLRVAEDRMEKSLRGVFESLTSEVRAGNEFVARDMWKPSLKVIAEQIPAAIHVLDRFHMMRNMNVAIDELRRASTAPSRRALSRD